ncbi:MAG: RNA 3'-phosphate cyclase [Nitrosopumilus sp. D6]|nr:MAG: RNA 3'-phosphate cyclase [Nitrosopumilus sp. D6]
MYLEIDGGYGEGGGQIVRSGLALSCITGQPVRIFNIRKNRRIPGLGAQHVTTARILQKISGAQVAGAERGSTEIKFAPGDMTDMDTVEDIKTAGSISLVLQVVILASAMSKKRLKLAINGGTDVPWSPTINYTRYVLGAAYARMGMDFSINVHRRGYYPKGGGSATLIVNPLDPKPVSFSKRTGNKAKLICTYSKMQADEIKEHVGKIQDELSGRGITTDSEISRQDAADPGASLLVYSAEKDSVIGVDALFGRRAFDLDTDCFVNSPGVDANLADMLVVPASLCGARTTFRVREITRHLETNLYVTSKITGCRYGIGRLEDGFEVIINGVSHAGIK